ncbi:cell division protein FtsQ/DivIB [Varunaivibrio sulfuroxidans]|uniref:Cell division protein FtsQ n=1 Tax=Varunaivibrio sulfuroxidans TaxID=1773489 RepID=A0A4R3J8M8_9PROT|nr:cell division protein FtsQ/DivIB [Varunaivibrio sulfuroxidans]TCS62198.1 cell division protein FtsQ [Varunaivibrio sulfuroxidans]WES30625.1 cell division protein FtsQ/DivIB [Varunaivibrio sulfuroxidans]
MSMLSFFSRKVRAKAEKTSPPPRRRVVPLWRTPMAVFAAVFLGGMSLGMTGWLLWQSGWMTRIYEQARWAAIARSADLGLTVKDILVVGRRMTARGDLLNAVRLSRGAPILAFDFKAARERIEQLPWVKTASVERMLPNTVVIRVHERTPMALWQNDGQFALIDEDGEVITRKHLERFADLFVVVGPDAPEHIGGLLEILSSQPALMRRVRAAVRVGGRRWDLRLAGGIAVRLPEKGALTAWKRLARYEREHDVLARDVRILDLRLPDRLIIRTSGGAKAVSASGSGRET